MRRLLSLAYDGINLRLDHIRVCIARFSLSFGVHVYNLKSLTTNYSTSLLHIAPFALGLFR